MKHDVKLKGQLRLYMAWPLITAVLLVILNAIVYAADRKAGDEQAKTEICQERGGGPQRDAAAAGNRRRSGRAGGIPSGKRRRMGGTGPLRHPGFARRKGGFFGERTAAQISRRAMRILHERYTTAGKSITLEKQNDRK